MSVAGIADVPDYDEEHPAWTPRAERECRFECTRTRLIHETVCWKISAMDTHDGLTRALNLAREKGTDPLVVDALVAVHKDMSRILAADEHLTWVILNERLPAARAELLAET